MKDELKQYHVASDPFWEGLRLLGGDGYDDMEMAAKRGWQTISAWGKAGWNLGSWPLVIVFFRTWKGWYEVAEYVEGDVTTYKCPTKALRNEVTDEIAFFHWKHRSESWVQGYESVTQLPSDLRGPYRQDQTPGEPRHD